MCAVQNQPQVSLGTALELMDLAKTAVMGQSLEDLAGSILPTVRRMFEVPGALLYFADSRMTSPCFFQHGLDPETVPGIERICSERYGLNSTHSSPQPAVIPDESAGNAAAKFLLYPLRENDSYFGLIGLMLQEDLPHRLSELWDRFLGLLSNAVSRLTERLRTEREISQLNTYLTVSSMLSQSLGLHDMLEVALYCCIEVVSAEAASILLVDEEKKEFQFYQVEGPSKHVLMTKTFPLEMGLAGSVLKTQQSEIINDVQSDPRFYKRIDTESGFQTRNMIALPLTAGEEKIGVLEVLNRSDKGPFTDEDRLLLLSIAEEIAFAIRNAKIFEYVVNSYCKQRQGQPSCRGCKRPLGSWTPCVRYREAAI